MLQITGWLQSVLLVTDTSRSRGGLCALFHLQEDEGKRLFLERRADGDISEGGWAGGVVDDSEDGIRAPFLLVGREGEGAGGQGEPASLRLFKCDLPGIESVDYGYAEKPVQIDPWMSLKYLIMPPISNPLIIFI